MVSVEDKIGTDCSAIDSHPPRVPAAPLAAARRKMNFFNISVIFLVMLSLFHTTLGQENDVEEISTEEETPKRTTKRGIYGGYGYGFGYPFYGGYYGGYGGYGGFYGYPGFYGYGGYGGYYPYYLGYGGYRGYGYFH
ncbi:unnamed protein product [Callosobruchus maculatus]|uniref:Uncharacterized protein n=1 Tax=Callosobruchus maculatus TaxID=64391 RepID=A0A653CGL4_CALMS|nr:unnamed protein product [Callosobruchus maculatus]